jgi:hypothetical protein
LKITAVRKVQLGKDGGEKSAELRFGRTKEAVSAKKVERAVTELLRSTIAAITIATVLPVPGHSCCQQTPAQARGLFLRSNSPGDLARIAH